MFAPSPLNRLFVPVASLVLLISACVVGSSQPPPPGPNPTPPPKAAPTPDPQPDPTPTPVAECPDEASPTVSYKSKDADQCARMRFACDEGQVPFSDANCGCGCKSEGGTTPPATSNCPEASVAGVDYKSKDTDFCSRARIMCPSGRKPFSSDCGCGCVPE